VTFEAAQPPAVPPGCAGAMAQRGVPSIVITTGGIGNELEVDAKILEYSVEAVFRELEVLESESSAWPAPPHLVGPRAWTHRASVKGLWSPTIAAGERVGAGQLLGEVCDYFGTVLETVEAPFDGWILTVLTTLAVDATARTDGDTWFMDTVTLAEARSNVEM
jgi:uncharacterized protein